MVMVGGVGAGIKNRRQFDMAICQKKKKRKIWVNKYSLKEDRLTKEKGTRKRKISIYAKMLLSYFSLLLTWLVTIHRSLSVLYL